MAHHFFSGAKLNALNHEIYFHVINYVLMEKQINNEYRNTLIYNVAHNQFIFCPMRRQNMIRNSATVVFFSYFAICSPPTACKLLKNYIIHCLIWLILNSLTCTTLLKGFSLFYFLNPFISTY